MKSKVWIKGAVLVAACTFLVGPGCTEKVTPTVKLMY